MPVITNDEIRSLADVRPTRGVVSCYLDVDGRRFVNARDYERTLDQLLRRARRGDHADEVAQDLTKIERYVTHSFERAGVRGLAVFSAGDDLWKVIHLPVPVRSELIVNPAPSLGQLEAIVQRSERMGILLVDKQTVKIRAYRLGELEDELAATDELPRDYDKTGEADRGSVQDHVDELLHQHLRHAAAIAWELHQRTPLDHLVIGASDSIAGEMMSDLHPYLRGRNRGAVDLGVDASDSQMRDAAIAVESRVEREREVALVSDLRAAVAAGGLGVAGLDATFDALFEHRVDRLLVSNGYTLEGWRCTNCDRLATRGSQCSCGEEMAHVEDVVAEAVEEALAQSCRVEVCDDNADLDVLGRIGALLRY